MGATGSNGESNVIGFLTNQSITLQASSAGVVSSFATATGEFWVYYGLTRVTTGITFSKVSNTGCTAAITAAGVYSVSAMSADNATAIFRAVYGGVTIDCVLTLSKSRAGTGVSSVRTEYYLSTSSSTQTGGTWQTTVPTWTAGTYIWERLVTVKDNSTETVGTPYLSQAWENINQLKSDLIEEQAKTQYMTSITGGVIYTALMKLFNPTTATETAEVSGDNDSPTNPALYAGGTYAEALGDTAKAIIRHDGSYKFAGSGSMGDVYVDAGGRLYIQDSLGVERFRFGNYHLTPLDVLRNSSQTTYAESFSTKNFGVTLYQQETYTETFYQTETLVVPSSAEGCDIQVSGYISMSTDNPHIHAYIRVTLTKDSSDYGVITTMDDIFIDNSVKDYSVKLRSVPSGTYSIKLDFSSTYSPVGTPIAATVTSQVYNIYVTTIVRNDYKAVHIASDGMMAFYSSDKVFYINSNPAAGKPFLTIIGDTDISGVLLSGEVNSAGVTVKQWGAKKDASSTSVKSSTGVYYVYHSIGHTNYSVQITPTESGRIYHVSNMGTSTFLVSFKNTSGSPQDSGFAYAVQGSNA